MRVIYIQRELRLRWRIEFDKGKEQDYSWYLVKPRIRFSTCLHTARLQLSHENSRRFITRLLCKSPRWIFWFDLCELSTYVENFATKYLFIENSCYCTPLEVSFFFYFFYIQKKIELMLLYIKSKSSSTSIFTTLPQFCHIITYES